MDKRRSVSWMEIKTDVFSWWQVGRQSVGGAFLQEQIHSNLSTILQKAVKGPSQGLLCLRPVKTSMNICFSFKFNDVTSCYNSYNFWKITAVVYLYTLNRTAGWCSESAVFHQRRCGYPQIYIGFAPADDTTPRGSLVSATHCFIIALQSIVHLEPFAVYRKVSKIENLSLWTQTSRSAYVQKTSSTFCPLAWVCHPSFAWDRKSVV